MAWGHTRRVAFVALYALALVVLPVLHHDIDCHFKTPMHCPACVASPMASPASPRVSAGAVQLPDVGEVALAPETRIVFRDLTRAFGRAPPA